VSNRPNITDDCEISVSLPFGEEGPWQIIFRSPGSAWYALTVADVKQIIREMIREESNTGEEGA
jgi:hypothetical protein